MIITNLEPTYARKVFPCFDDPKLKAIFKITLITEKTMICLSNMPVLKEEIIELNKSIKSIKSIKLKKVEFEETPIMSTYLVCWVIGNLNLIKDSEINFIKNTKTHVTGYYLSKSAGSIKSSIITTVRSIEYFEKLFQINYKLPKLDIIAVPSFQSGAMENWGLVTFREIVLFVDKSINILDIYSLILLFYEIFFFKLFL